MAKQAGNDPGVCDAKGLMAHGPAAPVHRRSAIHRAVICALGLSAGGVLAADDIDLANLGTGGFRVDGLDVLDSIGYAVSNAGDVNGDGFDDVILGAPYAGTGGVYGTSGTSYVVFGKPDSASVDLDNLGERGFLITGIGDADGFGFSVSGAGDVNGDGLADLIIGAPEAGPAGESFVVFGKTDGADVDLSDLGTDQDPKGFRIAGANGGDQSGSSVSGAGDVNGDGLADIIIGAAGASPGGNSFAGASFVVFGKADNSQVDLAEMGTGLGPGGFRINGIDPFDASGQSVAGAGDVNADGFDDVIIGASRAGGQAGESYVVFGKADNTTVDLVNLGTGGFRINGADAFDSSGRSVSGAGDVNGDGRADLIIGAPGVNDGGASYVVFGKASSANVELSDLGNGGFRIDGFAFIQAGTSVSGAGDVNGDGLDDVLVGAPFADPDGRDYAGATYVVFGKADSANLDLANLGSGGFRISGKDAGDRFGSSVSGGGDVNRDGQPDLVIGAPGAEISGVEFAGESYIVFGPSPVARPLFYTDREKFLSATQAVVATDPYVAVNQPPEPFQSGDILFDAIAPSSLAFGDWPIDFPGPGSIELAINDNENLDIALAEGFTYAMGVDFNDPAGGSAPSTFNVTVFAGDTEVASFQFQTQLLPDQDYIGVWAAVPFNRLEIRETPTANQNEFFGPVSTSQTPLSSVLFKDRFEGGF